MDGTDDIKLLDREAALERIGNDTELYDEIKMLFLRDAPPLLAKLGAAVAILDRDQIERHSHSLKSAAANLGAERLRIACGSIEDQCKTCEAAAIRLLITRVETEFGLIITELSRP